MTDFPAPNAFMRARRPERFSDSTIVGESQLTRSELEYFLSTLTSRSEEKRFEDFARSVAQRIICPNLLPQTGPTGGGDSKVDSETIPTSEVLALTWYVGNGSQAHTDRWGFAFSAKKDWKPKLKGDIAKLVGTDRGYKKAFFITNQFVPDRQRAEAEDALRGTFSIDVRILDLSWLLDKVFFEKLEDLAVDILGLGDRRKPTVRVGPRDLVRKEELKELEASISEQAQNGQLNLAFAEDCLRSARLARSLELSRIEVDGRFQRALNAAKTLDSSASQFEALYEWAWTAFWWYEDFARFAELTTEIFSFASGSRNAHRLSRLQNLWSCCQSAINGGFLTAEQVHFSELTASLQEALSETAADDTRPTNALHAQLQQILLRVLLDRDATDALFEELGRLVVRGDRLVGFPAETVTELVEVLSGPFGGRPAFEKLFETVVELADSREGDTRAAQMLLRRGSDFLQADDAQNAIRFIGRGLGRLHKHETKDELVYALVLTGMAYEQAGLLWAARGSYVTAASLETAQFHVEGRLTRRAARLYQRIRRIELALGRLPQTLCWHELTEAAEGALGLEPEEPFFFDPVLGIGFLNMDPRDLSRLEHLPDTLDGLNLVMARSALLFALGHPSEVPSELLTLEFGEIDEATLFERLCQQPAAEQVRSLASGAGELVILTSNILGCEITLECENSPPAVEISESYLAALEGLLSTWLSAGLHVREPVLSVRVVISEFARFPCVSRIEDELGRPVVHIAVRPFEPHSLNHAQQVEVKHALSRAVLEVVARLAALPDDAEQVLDEYMSTDRALQRALDFTGSFVSVGNVLGHSPKNHLSSWIAPQARHYRLLRDQRWNASTAVGREGGVAAPAADLRSAGTTATPPESFPQPSRHSDIKIVSVIREALWNRAGWKGVGFVGGIDANTLPILAFIFSDESAASQIFRGFIDDVGEDNSGGRLRISIIRGISAANPHWYRVLVGPSIEGGLGIQPLSGRALIINRIHTMEPSSSTNLERFLAAFARVREFHLAPAVVRPDHPYPLLGRVHIHMRALTVREAWQIGSHDIDGAALREDDDIAIPEGVIDAPIEALRERWRHRK